MELMGLFLFTQLYRLNPPKRKVARQGGEVARRRGEVAHQSAKSRAKAERRRPKGKKARPQGEKAGTGGRTAHQRAGARADVGRVGPHRGTGCRNGRRRVIESQLW